MKRVNDRNIRMSDRPSETHLISGGPSWDSPPAGGPKGAD